ncbi:MAG: Stealth CR1 domain-containing protein [Candidatus Cyclonatronum sp.]|uniref:Stealth CR1 domain-containing protein n=1 Tax=Cyclonatronum sp. TaxID=3024185 RepID=UPI0025C3ABA2|nr:Stealth CR1 domain-containing protein [Cyclonatronum sp.]MCC5933370.1 Stealth CR1 domain-containing protein [Balneolales bacterium]MCH8486587.1 Stealth CR1 domain-containing protein [Cyclonatronum sp.]
MQQSEIETKPETLNPEAEDPESIDAVIMWVDGNDPAHLEKRNSYAQSEIHAPNRLLTGGDKTRFVENGELFYCIKSIRKFAPWMRTIFLVTDNQRPAFATDEWLQLHGVQLVDHKDIFVGFEQYLPTFNTRTIESMLWRIPGLAPQFVYFNDDFLIVRAVKPQDFFVDSAVVLRGSWEKQVRYSRLRIKFNNFVSKAARKLFGITRSMHLLLQIKSARKAAFLKQYYRAPHVPHPVNRQTLASWFEAYPEELERNISWRFRNMKQFSAIFLANHLEISAGNVRFADEDDHLMINGETDISLTFTKKLSRIVQGEVRFACIQAMEKLSPANRAELEIVLNQLTGASAQQSYILRAHDVV